MAKNDFPALSQSVGTPLTREARMRQTLLEAERRAQTLRSNQQSRVRQRDSDSVPDSESDNELAADAIVAESGTAAVIAAAFDVVLDTEIEPQATANVVVDATLPEHGGEQNFSSQNDALAHLSCTLGVLGDLLLEESQTTDDDVISGSDDRVAGMALKNAYIAFPPRLLLPDPLPPRLPPARPTSRAMCERRCGSGGFCDPSSPLGCGGEYCGMHQDLLQQYRQREQDQAQQTLMNDDAAAAATWPPHATDSEIG